MIKVLFICHGNICRSPMAEFIFKDMVEKKEIKDFFVIKSAATSTEEIWGGRGNSIYPPAQKELKRRGIGKTTYTDFSTKRAVQVTKSDYGHYDYLLCADSNNIRNTMRITGPDVENKIYAMLDFAYLNDGRNDILYMDKKLKEIKGSGPSIADPWYTGNFEKTYDDIQASLQGFLSYVGVKYGII